MKIRNTPFNFFLKLCIFSYLHFNYAVTANNIIYSWEKWETIASLKVSLINKEWGKQMGENRGKGEIQNANMF